MSEQIIKSMLDDDLYKFLTQQAIIQKFPNAWARYELIDRDNRLALECGIKTRVDEAIDQLANLGLTDEELLLIRDLCPELSSAYIEFLSGYRYDPSEVSTYCVGNTEYYPGGRLAISIIGPWYRTVLWEVKLMAIISELYFQINGLKPRYNTQHVNSAKILKIHENGLNVSDFGTRRRYSYDNHRKMIDDMLLGVALKGTSNVHLAMTNSISPVGTQPHEWFMFHGAQYGYQEANRIALNNWVDVYNGSRGIALSDTFTSDVFFKNFDGKLARLYDGIRQDSGDPIRFIDKAITHYKSLGIDPQSKVIVFSDNLDIDKATKIQQACKDRIKCSFGIGTNLSNDVGVDALNMVIKMTDCKLNKNDEWKPTVKLSDNSMKHTGQAEEISFCKKSLRIKTK